MICSSFVRTICVAMMTVSIANTTAQTTAESPSDSWIKSWKPGLGCNISKEKPYLGTISLKQSLPADFKRGHHQWSYIMPTQAGATYIFKCYYRTQDIKNAFVQFHFRYPSGEPMPFQDFRFSTKPLAGTQDEWTELTHEVKAPANSASVEIGLRLNSPGTVYWSNPTLTLQSPPASTIYIENQHAYDFTDSIGTVRLPDPDKIADLNIKWVRYNVNWSQIENDGPGQWNQQHLQSVDKILQATHAKGIKVLLSLGYPPRWAARQNKDVRAGNVVARDLKDWQQYVAVVVGRTKDYVDTYRIMNEINHQWDTGAQPAEYTEFLKVGYRTIKAIAPHATVIMAGVSGTPGGFLQGIYDAGGGPFMDVVACQSYIHGHRSPEEGNLVARLQAYRMVMVGNNDMRPIWITEFGYPSVPLSSITPMQQAAYNVRSHLLALSSGAGVTKFFFYPTMDHDGDTITQTGGLYDRELKIKPLGYAVKTLAEVTNPVTSYVGTLEISPNQFLYNRLFQTKNNQHVWALWTTEGNVSLPLSFAKPVTIVSWDGKRSALTRELTLPVTENPSYVVGDLSDKVTLAQRPKGFGFETLATSQRNTTILPWLTAAPTVTDWERTPELKLKGKRNPNAGIVARAKVLGSAEGLYIRADIDDSSPASNTAKGFSGVWTQDSVELFVNRNAENAPAGFITQECNQLIATPGQNGENARVYWASKGSKSVQKDLIDAKISITIRPDRSGYQMDLFIPWKDWTKPLSAGESIGFDILATSSNERGERVETGAWFGDLENSTDASLWGVIRFEQVK